ncbi:hypothetical protein AB5I41_12680 [Sphingomonas sp. MMS24-JH45]
MTRPRALQHELGRTADEHQQQPSAAYAMLRDAFAQAQDYRRNSAGFDGRRKDSLLKRADAAALVKVLDGERAASSLPS